MKYDIKIEPRMFHFREPAGTSRGVYRTRQSYFVHLKDADGEELGYLSFRDDRMYYIVIPLFEQRRVRVRIQVSDAPASQGKGRNASFYQNLDLCIRLDPSQQYLPENLNL